MPTLASIKPSNADTVILDAESIHFVSIPCLLTADELDEKCEEQFTVIWNGINKPA